MIIDLIVQKGSYWVFFIFFGDNLVTSVVGKQATSLRDTGHSRPRPWRLCTATSAMVGISKMPEEPLAELSAYKFIKHNINHDLALVVHYRFRTGVRDPMIGITLGY